MDNLRAIATKAAELAVVPMVVSLKVQSYFLGEALASVAVSEQAAQWTGPVGLFMRRALLPYLIARVGAEVSVSTGTIFTKRTIELGNQVYIGRNCILGDVAIGDNTLIGDYVRIISGQHGLNDNIAIKDQALAYRKITIGLDAWLGSGATVMANVGAHSVVGAGSVVTKPVADYMIVAGNPAKVLRDRRQKADGS